MIENVESYIFQKYGTPWKALLKPNRCGAMSFIRQEAIWIVVEHSHMTLTALEPWFDRDRTTIKYSYNTYKGYILDGLIGKPDFRPGYIYKKPTQGDK